MDEGKYALPDLSVRKMYMSVSITVQTARSEGYFDKLLVNTKALLCAFYGNIMKLRRILTCTYNSSALK